jgi:hypothetical protein
MKNIKNILIMLFAIMAIIFLYRSCQMSKEHDNLLNQISKYQIGEKAFTQKLQKDSSTISAQTQTILSQKEAEKLGLIELKGDIKKLQSQVKQTQEIRYETLDIPFTPKNFADTSGWYKSLIAGDSSKSTLDSLLANSVIVPKSFSYIGKWISTYGKINKSSITIDSLKIPNESTVTIGWKKKGFLGLSKEGVVEARNTNPFLGVSRMNNVVIKQKKGLFQNPFFWTAVGVVAGHLLIK